MEAATCCPHHPSGCQPSPHALLRTRRAGSVLARMAAPPAAPAPAAVARVARPARQLLRAILVGPPSLDAWRGRAGRGNPPRGHIPGAAQLRRRSPQRGRRCAPRVVAGPPGPLGKEAQPLLLGGRTIQGLGAEALAHPAGTPPPAAARSCCSSRHRSPRCPCRQAGAAGGGRAGLAGAGQTCHRPGPACAPPLQAQGCASPGTPAPRRRT